MTATAYLLCSQFRAGFFIYNPIRRINHDAVLGAGAFGAHFGFADIAEDELGVAFQGGTIAAAAAGAKADNVAGLELKGGFRTEWEFLTIADENILGDMSRLAAEQAVWTLAVAVGKNSERRFVVGE